VTLMPWAGAVRVWMRLTLGSVIADMQALYQRVEAFTAAGSLHTHATPMSPLGEATFRRRA
jgi:hypothetical protein